MKPGLRRAVSLASGVLVGGACLWLAFFGVEPRALGRALAGLRPAALPAFLGMLTAFFWIKAWRWRVLLAGRGAGRLRDRLAALLLGQAAGLLLPAQLGEGLRAHALWRAAGGRLARTLASLATEKWFDLAALALLAGAALLVTPGLPEPLRRGALALPVLVAAGGVLALAGRRHARRVLAALAGALRLSPAWRRRLYRSGLRAAQGLDALARPGPLLTALAASLLMWAAMVGCVAAALHAAGLAVPAGAALLVTVAVACGMLLPAAPGYAGTVQYAFVLALAPFGAPAAAALAASLIYHVLIVVPIALALPASRIWARRGRRGAAILAGRPGGS